MDDPSANRTDPDGYPPLVGAGDRVVLFDGVCKLCGFWARFLIRFDRRGVFKLATVQSEEGAGILRWFGMPTDRFDTMVVVEGDWIFTKSDAFLRVMRRLPFPWFLAALGWVIPGFIRNWLYDRIAQNRYALFGKHEACLLPTPENQRRFLRAR